VRGSRDLGVCARGVGVLTARSIDDRLHPRDLEIVEPSIIQRRGDGLKGPLDIGPTGHC